VPRRANPNTRCGVSAGGVCALAKSAILFLALVVSIVSCGQRPSRSAASSGQGRPRNVVLITLDGLRQDHVSLFGYGRPTTPNLDRLGRNGVVYRSIIPTGCSTKTSLTSLLISTDFRFHHLIEHNAALDQRYTTLADAFRSHGYRTAAFVATPMLRREMGYNKGFDVFDDFSDVQTPLVDGHRVARRIIEFLSEPHRSRSPFFLYAHFEEPHPPWPHPSPWLTDSGSTTRFFGQGCTYLPSPAEIDSLTPAEREQLIARYDGAIRYADEQIGQILSTLDRNGLLASTVIGISTDHGIELVDRYSGTHGFNPFDEVVRTFFILFDGIHRSPSRPDDGIQGRIFDIGPTLLADVGITPPPSFQGVDLLRDAARLPEFAFTTGYGVTVVRSRRYKLIDAEISDNPNRSPYLTNGYHMFDLQKDPGERVDISAKRGPQWDALQEALASYKTDLSATFDPRTAVAQARLGKETLRRLRALGYLN
jgi:arylsulfatase A-like enzyme